MLSLKVIGLLRSSNEEERSSLDVSARNKHLTIDECLLGVPFVSDNGLDTLTTLGQDNTKDIPKCAFDRSQNSQESSR